MIPTSGQIEVAGQARPGPFVARVSIPAVVSPCPDRDGCYCVQVLGLVSCRFADPDIPVATSFETLHPQARSRLRALQQTGLIVHRSVIEHGAIQYLTRDRPDGCRIWLSQS